MSGPQLTAEKSAFLGALEARIAAGDSLYKQVPGSLDQYEAWSDDVETWSEYNREMLSRSFDSSEIVSEYDPPIGLILASASLEGRIERTRARLRARLRSLRSIAERIDFFAPAIATDAQAPKQARVAATDKAIFVVHGRRDDVKQEVARFLEKSTLRKVVILHEQAASGRTIIEKFEDYAAESTFAVVLLTGDDEGGLKGGSVQPRARQNVVFELGFFVGLLGRDRVAVVRETGVEDPSDMAGVNYIEFDRKGAWKLALAAELRAAKIQVDL